jgi:FkbM family methyltransferase
MPKGSKTTAVETLVVDAGGRYGIHPSWQDFKGDLRYFLFEPDVAEANRLAQKYAGARNIEVIAQALGDKPGNVTINVLRHHGQSTVFEPNPQAAWFSSTRRGEGDIVGRYDAPMTTVDLFCAERSLAVDFMKLDTEGSELGILRGAENQLRQNVLGLLCELHFDEVYIGAPRFPDVYSLLHGAGFVLLNLDYSGGGAYVTPFFDGPRYGILSGCDSAWVRTPQHVLHEAVPERILKYASFCMRNNATDLALHVLESAAANPNIDLYSLADTRLMRGVDVAVQHLFYRLSHKPRYDFEFLDETYQRIFQRRLKRMHEFFQSDDVNPAIDPEG